MTALVRGPHRASLKRSAGLHDHARTRALLLESTLRAATEIGDNIELLQHVGELANVPEDEFRRHFTDGDGLLRVLADGMSNELIAMIEGTAGDFVDAAKRIACGVRMYLEVARACPLFARFVATQGLRTAGDASLIHHYLPRHIASGVHTGRFADMSMDSAIALVAGTTLAAVERIAVGDVGEGYTSEVAAAILRGLGVPGMQARRLATVELPAVQPRAGSLLALAWGRPPRAN